MERFARLRLVRVVEMLVCADGKIRSEEDRVAELDIGTLYFVSAMKHSLCAVDEVVSGTNTCIYRCISNLA